MPDWTAHEQLLLRILAADGSLPRGPLQFLLRMALVSAAVADLFDAGRLATWPDAVELRDGPPAGTPLGEALLDWLSGAPGRRELTRIGRGASSRLHVPELAAQRLVAAGVLGCERRRILLVLPTIRYPWRADREATLGSLGEDEVVEAMWLGMGLGGRPPATSRGYLAQRVFDEARARTRLGPSPQG